MGPLIKAVEHESMRSRIILFATRIDESLEQLLRLFLKDPRKKPKEDELFRTYAPLSTFSARISMAYRLGLISKNDADAFDNLRGVRNDCAHKIFEFSNDDPLVQGRMQRFMELTCDDASKALLLGAIACPKTDEDCVMYCCLIHIIYLQHTIKHLSKATDQFTTDILGFADRFSDSSKRIDSEKKQDSLPSEDTKRDPQ